MNDLMTTLATVPELETLMMYKGLYALCTVDKDGKALKATHFCGVMIGGPSPVWAIWLVDGRFVRFANSRAQIEKMYPHLTWRRRMATWHCSDVTDKSLGTRRAELEDRYGKRIAR